MKNKLLASSIFAVTILTAQIGYTHGDHAPPPPAISQDEVLKTVSAEVANLVAKGQDIHGEKLSKGWEKVTAKVSKKGDGYYIVAMENSAEKKTLYMLLADYGKVWDANFSGKFKGINE